MYDANYYLDELKIGMHRWEKDTYNNIMLRNNTAFE